MYGKEGRMEYDRSNCPVNGGDWCENVYVGLEKWKDIRCIARDVGQQVENINSFMNGYKYVKSGSELEEYLIIDIRNRLSGIYSVMEHILDRKKRGFEEVLQRIMFNEDAGGQLFCGRAEYEHALALWEAGELMEDLEEIIAVSDKKRGAEEILHELSQYQV